jgi:hypothetical protein
MKQEVGRIQSREYDDQRMKRVMNKNGGTVRSCCEMKAACQSNRLDNIHRFLLECKEAQNVVISLNDVVSICMISHPNHS